LITQNQVSSLDLKAGRGTGNEWRKRGEEKGMKEEKPYRDRKMPQLEPRYFDGFDGDRAGEG